MMGEFHGGLFGLRTFWWLLLFAVVAATAWAIRPRRRRGNAALSAREILDQGYARGEIDAAEYDERQRRLEGENAGREAG